MGYFCMLYFYGSITSFPPHLSFSAFYGEYT